MKTDIQSQMNAENPDDVLADLESKSGCASATLLEGWSVQRRSYGVGTCFGGSGDVLCYGKWGVIGGTGRYKILFPSGWIEERPKFKTELEAMLWVMAKGKLKPSNDQADLPTPGE